MFTGVNYNMYQPPPGFCFDVLCDDKPIVDNQESKEYNVESRVYTLSNALVSMFTLRVLYLPTASFSFIS